MRKIAYLIASALCLGSCVYPYDDFAEAAVDNYVIEGDIVVGGLSYFLPTKLQPLGEEGGIRFVYSTVWVESDDGKTYPAEFLDMDNGYVADLTGADESRSYRLRVNTFNGKSFASQWGKAAGRVELDDMKYQTDTVANVLKIQVGLHSDGSSRHFRYRYFEDWEYHSYSKAYLYYDAASDNVKLFEGLDNTYYCWNTGISRGINLATTEKLSVDRLKDYTFKTLARNDERLSVMYRIKIDVYPVSPESYAYYENVRDVSSPTGDLFSPMPSEVRGNIRNMEDESEMVYGYVAVVIPSSSTLYYDNTKARFYLNTKKVDYVEDTIARKDFSKYYKSDYLPVREDPIYGFIWGSPSRCIDCRERGGTRNRPEGWPTLSY